MHRFLLSLFKININNFMSCSNCPSRDILNISKTETSDSSCGKLNSFNWMEDLPEGLDATHIVEVRFKNTRKEFYLNKSNIPLNQKDYVAVSSTSGHDIGQVTLMGKLAQLQYEKKKPRKAPNRIIYRKATKADIEKWHSSRLREKPVMIRARALANELKLNMKISDVEFQADASKAIFYYLADGRVDFRELIKLYAREFNVRVEMKQIGARQEAAMVGGIGSCGKELCCSSWRTDLSTVSSNAAKIQELPHNMQKLTGQCGKLKCCLMYELDSYLEAQEDFPDILLELETENGTLYPRKKELLKKIIWYSYSKKDNNHLIAMPLKQVKEIIMKNKKGDKPVIQQTEEPEIQVVKDEFLSFENDLSILNKKPKKKKWNKRRKQK